MHKIDAWVLSNFISIVKWLDVFRRKTISGSMFSGGKRSSRYQSFIKSLMSFMFVFEY